MLLKHDLGKNTQITFTLDYHELVTGDLRVGVNCRISYDPLRIVPQGSSYIHGDPNKPITAHIQFQQDGVVESKILWSPRGILKEPDIDITGQGSMLFQEFFIPEDACEVIIWFSYCDTDTEQTYYDNDFGKNFRFRFPYHDLDVLQAIVSSDPETPYSGFGVEVSAIPAIALVSLQFSVINFPDFPSTNADLQDTGQTDAAGNKIWSVFGIAVPYRSIVRFRLFYEMNGFRYKNDNAGNYFFAPERQPENVPPPPVAPRRIGSTSTGVTQKPG